MVAIKRFFFISFQVQDMDAKEKSPNSTGVHVNSSELGVGLEEDKPLDGVLGVVTMSTLFHFSLHRSPKQD